MTPTNSITSETGEPVGVFTRSAKAVFETVTKRRNNNNFFIVKESGKGLVFNKLTNLTEH